MINNIVFLYDASKEGKDGPSSKAFENKMTRYNLLDKHEKIVVYYLKILSTLTIKNIDEVYKIKISKQGNNKFKLFQKNLNLRSGSQLRLIMKKIKKGFLNKEVFYFLSCGHGSGMSIDPVLKLITFNNKINTLPSSAIKFTIENSPVYPGTTFVNFLSFYKEREDVWEYEKIWSWELSKALKIIKPVIGVFYNCDTNFLDSLLYYKDCMKYSYGSENYLVNYSVDLPVIFNAISKTPQLPTNENLKHFFKIIDQGFSRAIGTANNKNPCIFLIDLKYMTEFAAKFDEIISKVNDLKIIDKKWLLSLQNNTDYLSPANWLVDLVYLLYLIKDKVKNDRINDYLEELEVCLQKVIIDKHVVVDDTNIARYGITVYFPKTLNGDFDNNLRFKEYYQLNEKAISNFEWYKLLIANGAIKLS